jgi:capsular exopolysaccharide synthesis family protein
MNEMIPTPRPEYAAGAAGGAEHFPAPKFRLQTFWLLSRQYWWLPTGVVVMALLGAAFYGWHKPATYLSVGSMWETVKLQSPEGPLFGNTEELPGTQNDLLRSSLVQARVLARLASNNIAIPRDSRGARLPVTVQISQTAKSAVFTWAAIGPEPLYTQAYLDALMESYLELKANVRQQISGLTLATITKQIEQTEQDLKSQQDVLTEFERTNNLAILQEEGTVAGGYLTKLKTQLSDLQSEARLLESASADSTGADTAASQTNQDTRELAALILLPGEAEGGVLAEYQKLVMRIDLLKVQHAELSVNLREQHPKMQHLAAEIAQASEQLDAYRHQSREQLAATTETTRKKIESVQNAIKDWESRVVEANARIAAAEQLKDNVARSQAEYNRLVGLAQNFKISRDFDQDTLTILEHASPANRSNSAMKKALASAVAGGLMLGFACIALLTLRDEKFGSVREVQERLGGRVIAQVPESTQPNPRLLFSGHGESSHLYAESFRSLRSALLYLTAQPNRPKMLLITSALPNEGKSTVAVNLAHSLALGGARVLLVDADLRRGRLHELLDLKAEPGLGDLLDFGADTGAVFQTNSLPNLSFIARGRKMINPGDQMLGSGLDQLFSEWRREYDYVLIDSSPIFAADDVTTLAAKVDGTLLVVRSRYAGAREVREALEMLYHRQAKVLGIVFNRCGAAAYSYDRYKYGQQYYQTSETVVS